VAGTTRSTGGRAGSGGDVGWRERPRSQRRQRDDERRWIREGREKSLGVGRHEASGGRIRRLILGRVEFMGLKRVESYRLIICVVPMPVLCAQVSAKALRYTTSLALCPSCRVRVGFSIAIFRAAHLTQSIWPPIEGIN